MYQFLLEMQGEVNYGVLLIEDETPFQLANSTGFTITVFNRSHLKGFLSKFNICFCEKSSYCTILFPSYKRYSIAFVGGTPTFTLSGTFLVPLCYKCYNIPIKISASGQIGTQTCLCRKVESGLGIVDS